LASGLRQGGRVPLWRSLVSRSFVIVERECTVRRTRGPSALAAQATGEQHDYDDEEKEAADSGRTISHLVKSPVGQASKDEQQQNDHN
jgi:hypothetical protein